jgi:hypothetical protein
MQHVASLTVLLSITARRRYATWLRPMQGVGFVELQSAACADCPYGVTNSIGCGPGDTGVVTPGNVAVSDGHDISFDNCTFQVHTIVTRHSRHIQSCPIHAMMQHPTHATPNNDMPTYDTPTAHATAPHTLVQHPFLPHLLMLHTLMPHPSLPRPTDATPALATPDHGTLACVTPHSCQTHPCPAPLMPCASTSTLGHTHHLRTMGPNVFRGVVAPFKTSARGL